MSTKVGLIADATFKGEYIQVRKYMDGSYAIFVNGKGKHEHNNCTADDVIRALSHYLNEIKGG